MSSPAPVWFIIGASSGFGLGIAQEALKRGHLVIATARKSSSLKDLADAGAHAMDLDVAAAEDVIEAKVKQAHDVHGRLTYMVNAAGYALEGTCEESNDKEVFDQFNTNVLGTIRVARAVIPYLRSQGSGVIANFGSLSSWNGMAAMGFYNATKWAVSGFTETLAIELAPLGISVISIEPGMFRTEFLNAGRRISTERRMPDVYSESGEKTRAALDQANNNQLGDVKKGSQVTVDVLTRTGVAEGREIPIRLVLGSDTFGVIKGKCESTLKLLDEWKDVAVSTDYADMK